MAKASTMDERAPAVDTVAALESAQGLDDLYPVLHANRYTAGWHKKRRSLWPSPASEFTPQHWRYAESRLALDRAGEWIGTDLAERRNLLVFNPVGDNDYATTRTLVAAYQMVKPGEHARAHRHSPNALRLVLDAPAGLYTVVDGVQLPMIPGDILLTPGNCWHSHFAEKAPSDGLSSYWIDFLDVPLVQLLEPMFYEEHPAGYQPVKATPTQSPFWFPFAQSKSHLARAQPGANGVRRHVLPSAEHIATMDLTYLHLVAGTTTGLIQSTEQRIITIPEGKVRIVTPSQEATLRRGDLFAVPGWTPFEIIAGEDSYVFEVSDAPVQKRLGLHRSASVT